MNEEQVRAYIRSLGGNFDVPTNIRYADEFDRKHPPARPGPGDTLVFRTSGEGTVDIRVVGPGQYEIAGEPRVSNVPRTETGQAQYSVGNQIREELSKAASAHPLVADAIQAAVRHGLPPNVFVAQINQESGFDPNAVSPAGARGIAQIMPDSATAAGVDPMNPAAALDYAATRMANALSQYGGDWPKALASYNAGAGAVEQAGGVPDYPETRQYISRVMAAANDPTTFTGLAARAQRESTETEAQRAERYASATASLASAGLNQERLREMLAGGSEKDKATAREALARAGLTEQELTEHQAGGTPLQQAETGYKQAQTQETLQKLLPPQQRAIEQGYQTIESIRQGIRDGSLSAEDGNRYFGYVHDYIDAALQGTTPWEKYKLAQEQTTQRGRLGMDVLNRQVESGNQLAQSLLTGYLHVLPHLRVGTGGFNPLEIARQYTQAPLGQGTLSTAQQLYNALGGSPAGGYGAGPGAGGYGMGMAGGGNPFAGITISPERIQGYINDYQQQLGQGAQLAPALLGGGEPAPAGEPEPQPEDLLNEYNQYGRAA